MTINEANISNDIDLNLIKINGYTMETDNLMEDYNISRTIMYIKNSINYTREHQYEASNESSISIQLPTLPNQENRTINISSQNERFNMQIDKWNTMMENNPGREFIFSGDFNLDDLAWIKYYKDKDSYEKKQHCMVSLLQDNILSKNFYLINNKATRTDAGQKSQLDLFISNRPDKIHDLIQVDNTTSDHSLIIVNHQMKIVESEKLTVCPGNIVKLIMR